MIPPGELDRALAELGEHLAYPPTPDIAGGVRGRLANQPARRRPFTARVWWLAVAAGVLIAVAGASVAASPEARTAIAERLGLRGVTIQQVPTLPTPASVPSPAAGLNLGQPMTLEQVRARVAFSVLVPAALGAPDEVYLLNISAGGQVALVYRPRPDLPQAKATGVGLLLTEFQGNVSSGVIGKGLPSGTRLEEIQVNGSRGYWIDGDPHNFFYVDSRGQFQTETTRLAGSVLLWEHGDLTLRLEAALPKDAALQIAASVQ